jgi:threonylcarbamoyladenosine tRNA methylthiotransferase MtaB
MKIKILSLGCRLNQSEIESISTTLQNRGHEIVRGEYADIYIINSCAVTARSERKTRQLINQSLTKVDYQQEGRVIVTGCASAQDDQRVMYLSNDYKYMIPDIIDHPVRFASTPPGRGIVQPIHPDRFKYDVPLKCSTNRVNLKIQDGCNNLCSYCRIPLTRGGSVSKSFNSVIDEFKLLLDNDFKEIILTGVNIGDYNDGDSDLADLVEGILKLDGESRLHLTSLDPDNASVRLLDLFKEDKMVKHLHLSLQSGSDRILERMSRPYNRKDYISVTERLKSIDRDFNFTTDVIAGFPGETDIEFNETLSIIKEVGFSHIHTFRFSSRPGTEAAEMDGIVPEIAKTQRSREIIKLYSKQKIDYYRKFSGRHGIFLSEKYHRGVTTGYNEHYIPVEINEKLPKNHFFKIEFIYNENKKVLNGNLLPL